MKKGFIIFIVLVLLGIGAYTLYKENNPYSYQIIEGYRSGNYDYTKKGYYIDTSGEENAPYYYIITMGSNNTSGYSLKVDTIEFDYYGNAHIVVREEAPKNNDLVSMAFTYPSLAIRVDKAFHGITVKNTDGEEYLKLN